MEFIDNKYNEFVNSKDFEEIGSYNLEIQQLIMMLHFRINDFGIPSYPVFKEKDRSSSGLKVFNVKIQKPNKIDEWDDIATIKPYKTMIELFTTKSSEPQQSYLFNSNNMNECEYKSKTIEIGKVLEDIKELYDIRIGNK